MTPPRAVALDLDGALVDTRPLWRAWLDSAEAVLGIEAASLPPSRADAAEELDRHAPGNWRALLERFCEERIAVYVRRDAATGEALRTLAVAGCEIGVYTDAPEPLARLALGQIGADRRVARLVAGADALARLRDAIGADAVLVTSPSGLRETSEAALSGRRDS